MKKMLLASVSAFALAGTAFGADMTAPAFKAPPPPVANWAGFYLGIDGGVARHDAHFNDLGGFLTGGTDFGSKTPARRAAFSVDMPATISRIEASFTGSRPTSTGSAPTRRRPGEPRLHSPAPICSHRMFRGWPHFAGAWASTLNRRCSISPAAWRSVKVKNSFNAFARPALGATGRWPVRCLRASAIARPDWAGPPGPASSTCSARTGPFGANSVTSIWDAHGGVHARRCQRLRRSRRLVPGRIFEHSDERSGRRSATSSESRRRPSFIAFLRLRAPSRVSTGRVAFGLVERGYAA